MRTRSKAAADPEAKARNYKNYHKVSPKKQKDQDEYDSYDNEIEVLSDESSEQNDYTCMPHS